jgi:hypothetical protein
MIGEVARSPHTEIRLPEVWASVCSLAEEAGLCEGTLPEIGWTLVMVQAQDAATARQTKRMDQAKEIVSSLEEFARGLVARFPRDPWSHLAMSEAQIQVAKNAWKVPGYAGPEEATHRALASAQRALELDPHHGEARIMVADRQRRVARLPRPASPEL